MPGTTAYPAALDTFPDIGPNTAENATGFEHDAMHNNKAAAIAALQAKVGIDGSADPESLDARVAAVEAGKLDASEVGSTVASLVSGKVPSAQLPSYVDDVIEVADYTSLPATGETGKVYIVVAAGPDPANSQYRWSGSAYVLLVASPGSTDAVPEGTTNLYFTDQRAYLAAKAAFSAGTHSGVSFTFNDATSSISVTASGGGGSVDIRDVWLFG
jgi:hypothetical protein